MLDAAVRGQAGHAPIASVSACVLGRADDGSLVRWTHTAGMACVRPAVPARAGQVYDLASLTKALAGSVVAARLAVRGALDVDAPLATWLPVDPRVTVWHLLTHTSGLPAWRPLYRAGGRDDVIAAALAVPLDAAPGERHVYSDVGYLWLLAALERAGGARLDALLPGWPGLTWGHPDAAATEDCPHRGRIVQGEVHDLNAWAMGGISTHAGLFGDAVAVAERVRWLVAPPEGPDDLRTALRTWWARPAAGTHRGGWDRRSDGYTSSGAHFPPDTVGHLGYTGTAAWASPGADRVAVLLTNRVHPRDDDASRAAIRALRPAFFDAAWAMWTR